jgi:phage shock protein E
MAFRLLLTLLLLGGAAPLSAQVPSSGPATPAAMPVQELAARIEAGRAPDLILDVRTRAEYDAGHVPRARLIPEEELAAALDNLKAFQHAEVVVYCRTARRSTLAEALLREHGFTGVVQLEGSWQAWEAARLPVELTRSEKPQ